MGERYLLIAGGTALERSNWMASRGVRHGLTHASTSVSFDIWVNAIARIVDLQGQGALIGSTFQRHGPPRPVVKLSPGSTNDLCADDGRPLIRHYWGSYVAALETANGPTLVRAPMGGLPCYHASCDGFLIAASDPDLLVRSGLFKASINWAEVGRHLHMRGLPVRHTCLDGLDELLPGTALFLQAGRREDYWSPWDHVASASPGTPRVDLEHVRRVIENCVGAWSWGHERMVASVSGGLDSSVVASILARQSRGLTGVTLATEDPSGDERPYARALCNHLGVPLIERHFDLAAIDLNRSVAAHLPRPSGTLHEHAFRSTIEEAVTATGASGYFSGNGGDHVFYNSASARPIADRLLSEGPGAGTLATVRNVCAVTGASAASAIGQALKMLRKRGRNYKWSSDPHFLDRAFVQSQAAVVPSHPWLIAPPGSLPGDIGRIAMLLRILPHLDAYDRAKPFSLANPLVSQPIVEACLGIPSWQMCAGGQNRAIIRQCFADRLPAVVVNRRTKAGPDSFIVKLLDQRLDQIRDRLLGGRLVQAGLIDAVALEGALVPGQPRKPTDYLHIMMLADCEAWIERWNGAATSSFGLPGTTPAEAHREA